MYQLDPSPDIFLKSSRNKFQLWKCGFQNLIFAYGFTKKGDAINADIVFFMFLRPTTFQAIARCVSVIFHMLQRHNTCFDVQALSSSRLPNLISRHWTKETVAQSFNRPSRLRVRQDS